MRPLVSEGDLGTLGAGMDSNGLLSAESMRHVVSLAQKYRVQFVKHQVEKSVVVCTQAVRNARNAEEFIHDLRQVIANVVVLTPEQEAQYSFKAALLAFQDRIGADDRFLVVDQGGGSVELSSGRQSTPPIYTSLPIGTVALTAALLDAPSLPEGYCRVDEIIYAALETNRALDVLHRETPAFIFGMGSAIRKLGEALARTKNVHGYAITALDIAECIAFVQEQFGRAHAEDIHSPLQINNDFLTTACGLLTFHHVLQKYGGSEVIMSLEGLRHGVLRSLAMEDAA